jgi:hypothetical protein
MMLGGKHLTRLSWPFTYEAMNLKINRVSYYLKCSVCTKFGQNQLQDVDYRVFTRMLVVTIWNWDLDILSLKSIVFQMLLRTKYVPSVVKLHWRMFILEFSQGCYVVTIWNWDLDIWSWKSIEFQILIRTKYVYAPYLFKIHWRMFILECSQGCYVITILACDLVIWPWK